jgi:predicted nucleotidyltransferase
MSEDLNKWYYTRELAKLSKVGLGTVSSEFSKLAKEGLVEQKTEGQEKYYKLNLANPRTRKVCELFETDKREKLYKENRRLAWVLEDFTKRVSEFASEIQSIILFGSAARGQATSRSDVDVLVIAPNSEEERFKKLMDSIDKLANEVSGRHPTKLVPVVMMTKDFEKSIKDQKRFTADVLKDGIVLFGQEKYYHLLSRVI